MYTGYLELGGREIANTDRLHGYLHTADCVLPSFNQTPCGTLQDALGDSTYEAANISAAPWFDPAYADVSSRFYGVAAYDITGVHDSSRSLAVTQAITDGGILGDKRHATKEVKVQALLIAKGQDALDYGLNWLNAQLEPGACGQHGTACGFADLTFFTTCPPEMPLDWSSTEGGVTATNMFTNPRMQTLNAQGVLAGFSYPIWAPTQDMTWGSSGTSARISKSPAPSDAIEILPVYGLFDPPEEVTASVRILIPEGYDPTGDDTPWDPLDTGVVMPRHRVFGITWQSTTAPMVAEYVDIPLEPGEYVLTVTGTRPAGYNLVTVSIVPPFSPDQYYLADEFTVAAGSSIPGPFSGSTVASGVRPSVGYRWTGAVDESTSEAYAINWTSTPNHEEMDKQMRPIERYLHDVGVTSGLTVREYLGSRQSVDSTKAADVEFTVTSERGYVYERARDVPLLLTADAYEDVSRNIFLNPTADRAGASQVIRRNLITNPSLETNVTDWYALGGLFDPDSGEIGGQSVAVTGARVLNELRAVGTASFKVTRTGSALGLFAMSAAWGSTTPAASRWVTPGIWGAVTDAANQVTELRAQYCIGTDPWVTFETISGADLAAAKDGYFYRAPSPIQLPSGTVDTFGIRFVAIGPSSTAVPSSFIVYADAVMVMEG